MTSVELMLVDMSSLLSSSLLMPALLSPTHVFFPEIFLATFILVGVSWMK